MKKFNSYYWLAFINFIITVFMVIFIWSTIFPKSTIMENGDITINVRGLIINHLEVQQFETNVETIETELVYLYEPVNFGESEIIISNEDVTYIDNVMFHDGSEYKFTFGEVIAYPRLGAILLISILYIAVTIIIIPYIFRRFT